MLHRVATARRPVAMPAWPLACAWRGLAVKRTKRAKAKEFDLGWGKLQAPLEAAPLHIPSLQSLRVLHGSNGAGLTGARKFKRLMPALRWQNPEAQIELRWDDASRAAVELQFAGGSHELDVSGRRSEDILGLVLQTVGAPEDDVARSVEWAEGYLRSLERRAPESGVEALVEDGENGVDEEESEHDPVADAEGSVAGVQP